MKHASPSSSGPAPTSLPLSQLLAHTAEMVAAVQAGRSLSDVLAACPAAARPGTQALSFHVMRWMGGAQAARELLAPRRPAPRIDALLITALALLWPEAQAPYAEHTLVDQTVACARRLAPASAGFVNAVLRRFLRERTTLLTALQQKVPAARHQHPRWWIEQVRRDWPDRWEALLAAANQPGPMMLRVHARHGTAADYVHELEAAGLQAHAVGPQAPQAVLLETPAPVQALPGFAEGRVSVQDLSAQRAAPLLLGGTPGGLSRLPAGARVLDACAAPGGKTAHLLELADLDLLALDTDAGRLARVDETLKRLSLSARTQAADARDTASWWDGRPFDAIVLDAPCSASGIVRRHPDVRWLRRASDIAALAQTQAALLDALWPLLRPGGRLLYATCSIFRAEGAGQIAAFLQRQPQAMTARAPGHLLPLSDNRTEPGDGFFYALLHKSSDS
ncbi:MAG: rRNA ((967)-C(5))-methyltransferase RsmB [Pseudomonadota bacterium]